MKTNIVDDGDSNDGNMVTMMMMMMIIIVLITPRYEEQVRNKLITICLLFYFVGMKLNKLISELNIKLNLKLKLYITYKYISRNL